jgi:ATP-binding cassette subfamily B protein
MPYCYYGSPENRLGLTYTPQRLRQLIDKGNTPLSLQFVWGVAGVLVVLAAGRGLFNFLQGYLGEVTSRGVL